MLLTLRASATDNSAMTLYVLRLPLTLDPLIREAKKRAWRRRLIAVLLALAAVAVGVTFGLRVFGGPNGGSVAGRGPLSGSYHGISWRIRAADSGDGRYGMTVFVAGSPVASRSGRFYVPGPSGPAIRLGWTSDAQGRLPFVAGAVALTSCCEQEHGVVNIRLSDGAAETVTATVPPYTLAHAPGIAFFFAATPRGAHPVTITARNIITGRVFARWNR